MLVNTEDATGFWPGGAKKVCEFVDEIFTIGDMVTPETYNNDWLLY